MFGIRELYNFTKKSILIFDVFTLLLILLFMTIDIYLSTKISSIIVISWIILSTLPYLFFTKLEGINDEMTEKIMSKVNEICIKYALIVVTFIGLVVCGRATSFLFPSKESIGIVVIVSMLIFTILRLILFIHYERKGIYE